MFKVIPNKDKKYCCAYRCFNLRPQKDCLCPKHRKRKQKETDPERYAYYVLKCNAKRRGKSVELTLAEFRLFCQQTGYIDGKGRTSKAMSIDRIDNTLGYSITNIRILSLQNNSAKGTNSDDDCPF